MQDLTLTLIQPQPQWHRIEENLACFSSLLAKITQPTDIIVLPEMFTTGFTMDSALVAEKMGGRTHNWLLARAASMNAAICGSIVVEEDGHYYNRFLWVTPDGHTEYYDKRHLFRMADEHDHYQPGNRLITIEYKGWRIRPMVCYDLRFPVWARNQVEQGRPAYDLLLYVANWPASRISAWDALLRARAVENLAYSAGVNRLGKDEKDIIYNGHSGVYGPKGETIYFMEETEVIARVALGKTDLEAYRQQFPAYLDADRFSLDDTN